MILSLALLAAVPDAFPAPKTPTGVLRISCRQGECGWQQIKSIERVRGGNGEVLRKLTSRSGNSVHGAFGDPPRRYTPRLRVKWDTAPRVEYVLCSKRRPTVIFPSDGEFVVHRLGLTNLGGYEYASATLYMQVCHNVAPDRWSEKQAARMGYSRQAGRQDEYKTLAAALATLR
ncbi:MAG: hypothetical protein KF730_12145 [Sphingomonas sp.]|uniref:hypothetical protein n=1 Tax=Sphingomonas sp. TaxID=28214 RepID=UPI0025D1C4E2|nr:hypothetical protein [Sphingomonas sp.]MBX3565312.1 hypothetical protein [Sphingomonas sp.]